MNELTKARYSVWASNVQARLQSGMTVKAWCDANGIPTSTYYNRLNRLKRVALEITDNNSLEEHPVEFARVPDRSMQPTDGCTLRISRADTVIEVSNDASDRILLFLREVLS